MKPDRRGSWYLLTGVVLGVAIGLLYAWLVSPVKYVDAPPYALRADYKEVYRVMVASAYMYNHDLLRAQSRLAQLKDDDPVQALALQAGRAQADGHPLQEVLALNTLAGALRGIAIPPADGSTPLEPAATVPYVPETTPSSLILKSGATLAVTQQAALLGSSPAFIPTTEASGNPTALNAVFQAALGAPQPAIGAQLVSVLVAPASVANGGSRFWGASNLAFVQP